MGMVHIFHDQSYEYRTSKINPTLKLNDVVIHAINTHGNYWIGLPLIIISAIAIITSLKVNDMKKPLILSKERTQALLDAILK